MVKGPPGPKELQREALRQAQLKRFAGLPVARPPAPRFSAVSAPIPKRLPAPIAVDSPNMVEIEAKPVTKSVDKPVTQPSKTRNAGGRGKKGDRTPAQRQADYRARKKAEGK